MLLAAILAGAALANTYASDGSFAPFRVMLDHRAADPREPAKADWLDCPEGKKVCQAIAFPRVMADEKIVLPRNKALESLRFLSLRGIRVQSGDPALSLALFPVAGGDSVFADLNNDEDLGNDGPPRFWPQGDSCVTLERVGGGMAPVSLCRAGSHAKTWQAKCESLKSTLTWALCEEPPYRVRVLDLTLGTLSLGGISRQIGFCDADGDGKILSGTADRLVVDWDGDGSVEKSLEADGVAMGGTGSDGAEGGFRFSLDSATFEILSWDDKGGWMELRRLSAFDPGAASFKAVEGRKAPDIRFVNMDGDTLRLSDFRGKKIMIQFWSTLCKPCLDHIAAVRDFHKAFAAKNWEIISITTDTDLPQVQQAVMKYHMDWMVGMAGPEARRYYASRPLPLNVKINEQGILEKRDVVLGQRAF